MLSLIAVAIVVWGVIVPLVPAINAPDNQANSISTSKNVTRTSPSQVITTTETITNTTGGSSEESGIVKFPEFYLVLVGFIILIILSPQLKSLKAGPVEVELQTTILTIFVLDKTVIIVC